jgi:hypothetical protein
MSDKRRFGFLIRPKEREALKRLSEAMDRSEGAVLRTLIRQAERDILPADLAPTNRAYVQPQPEVCRA